MGGVGAQGHMDVVVGLRLIVVSCTELWGCSQVPALGVCVLRSLPLGDRLGVRGPRLPCAEWQRTEVPGARAGEGSVGSHVVVTWPAVVPSYWVKRRSVRLGEGDLLL